MDIIEKKSVKEVVVVEGQKDTEALRRAVQADTIETRGSAVGPEVIAQVKRAQQSRGVIILTDPDGAGERIRRILSRAVPGCKHAFVPRDKAVGKRGLGVEHVSPKEIVSALQNARWEEGASFEDGVTWERYLDAGMAGGPGSRFRREEAANILGIGYANAKQFFRRLHLLRITEEEFEEVLLRMRKDDTDD
nr:ribonuclease M5 [Melghirimyces algeriensis]